MEKWETLEAHFSLEEVRDVIWLGDKDKSLGPNGYNICFFKLCYDFLKDVFIMFVNEFYLKAKVSKAVTTSFLALISKGENP